MVGGVYGFGVGFCGVLGVGVGVDDVFGDVGLCEEELMLLVCGELCVCLL